MTLVIMAAGMGSRYGGLKQIDPVGKNGEFILDYSIFDAIAAGFSKVVFIIKEENYRDFRDTVGRRIERAIPAEYVFQKVTDIPAPYQVPEGRTKPWGTAHAVLTAAPVVHENFAVINADDFYGRDSFMKLGAFLKSIPETGMPAQYCMAGFVLKNTLTENGHVARGVCVTDEKDHLVSVTERTRIQRIDGQVQFCENDVWTPLNEDCTVSMNCWGFTPAVFDAIRRGMGPFFERVAKDPMKAEYYLPGVVTEQLEEGSCTVKVLPTDARWYGVTYHEDKATVVRKIAEMTEAGIYPEKLWNE